MPTRRRPATRRRRWRRPRPPASSPGARGSRRALLALAPRRRRAEKSPLSRSTNRSSPVMPGVASWRNSAEPEAVALLQPEAVQARSPINRSPRGSPASIGVVQERPIFGRHHDLVAELAGQRRSGPRPPRALPTSSSAPQERERLIRHVIGRQPAKDPRETGPDTENPIRWSVMFRSATPGSGLVAEPSAVPVLKVVRAGEPEAVLIQPRDREVAHQQAAGFSIGARRMSRRSGS